MGFRPFFLDGGNEWKGNSMRKVLIVDDDESIRDFLKLHFEDSGFQVILA